MSNSMVVDLRQASDDALVDFYFDHPDMDYRQNEFWFTDIQVLYDPSRNAEFFCRLFRAPGFLLQKFRRGQVDQAFWAISGYGFEGNVTSIIFEHNDLPFDLRLECIRTMYELYEHLFAVDPIGESSAFWWGHVAGYWGSVHVANEVRRTVSDTIFETLLRILQLDSEYCQSCALSGLEKLRHRDTASALKAILKQQPRLSKIIRNQALSLITNNPPYPL